jgi:S-formylglutathione hydrolase
MNALSVVSEHACYGGVQRFYRHESSETRGPMKFAAYLPPQARLGKVPVLYFLSGLTCTEETFCIKSHAQKFAAEFGLMLISPDTSPREPRIPGDADNWDFGYSAGFYVDATQEPWSKNYRMYSYVTRELPQIVAAHLPANTGASGRTRSPYAGAAQSLAVPVGVRICPHRGTDAMPLGQKGICQLSWPRLEGVARI